MNTEKRKDVPPATRRSRKSRLKMSLLAMSALFILTTGTVHAAIDPATAQKLVPERGSGFGYSVSLSADGRTALIGDPMIAQGVAYIFTRADDGAWSQEVELTPSENDKWASGEITWAFGETVSLSADANTALIHGLAGRSASSEVHVFHRTATEGWKKEAVWEVSRSLKSFSLSADGKTAIIGGRNTFIYTRTADGKWNREAELTKDVAEFGASVALSADGQTALIGAAGGKLEAGRAYLVTRSADGSWDLDTYTPLSASDPALDDGFGLSVSLNSVGDTALIVAGGSGDLLSVDLLIAEPKERIETAYIFHVGTKSGAGVSFGFQYAKLQLPDIISNINITASQKPFSFSADGGTILIGNHRHNTPVYLFTGSGKNWTKQELPPPADANKAPFGRSVSLSADGNTALVGVGGGSAVYVFTDLVQPSNTPKP